ncbi:tetratricopeptide repeat protein [Shewanella sp. WXL01]|uniref:Tetratricopeptide repeat protein n=1 Tax=Shewanella maritima TaxID=2520507 RepID=A0A411PFX1_9GAMM|nr:MULTISPECIES: tetratricopeptide repeat protein [Shewanella]NKF49602.1 tetratricopeptide repeat protein [Shewanella sp. WXL01]QBF82302.1 tetratricopeptide repeat protein [Shewanella maritima]
MKHTFLSDDSVSIPETAFDLSEHLGFLPSKAAQWAWYELSGSVLSRYVVDQQARLDGLFKWFFNDLGFCAKEDYFSVEAADLSYCVTKRQGNSTTLSTLLVLLAKQLDLPLEAVLLPGHTVLRSKLNGKQVYHDPFSGEPMTRRQLHNLVRGELGNAARLKPKHVKAATVKTLISRMLNELKASCILTQKFEQAMECCSLLLQWHPGDVHLNRERAFIAQQLGCIKVAMSDLQHFIDSSPHDPVTELVKMQLKELSQQSQTLH